MVRIPSPSSRGAFAVRLSAFDVAWTFASPLLSLWFRDANIYLYTDFATTGLYFLVCTGFSLIAFLAFKVGDGVTSFFSVHDALDLLKAVVCAELMTCMVLFSLTRLEGIPRSTPVIHALILAAGLISIRLFVRIFENDRRNACETSTFHEHIIIIGSNRLSSLYIKMLEAFHQGWRVVAVLDNRAHLVGRAIEGVRILGVPQDLEAIVDEFAVHGIRIDRVLVGGETDLLCDAALDEVQRTCRRRDIGLNFVPRLIGLSGLQIPPNGPGLESGGALGNELPDSVNFVLPTFFGVKRFIDFSAALMLLILLLPLFAGVGLLVLLDVGSPVFFWQQRLGQRQRPFLVYKFRTLKLPLDWGGQRVPENERISWIGQLLRETSLDELPQLLNVLVGDMSLIGPRPLLPEDQPSNPTVRLMVRPGITGWAQVNGAKLLTPEEKDGLDEWYIRNVSLWLDLRIVLMTLEFVLKGPNRPDSVNASEARQDEAREWKELATAKRKIGRLDGRS
jgi:lipopolysaccharide/colanic/teichoic acid biosynthesis glycosyltransferase